MVGRKRALGALLGLLVSAVGLVAAPHHAAAVGVTQYIFSPSPIAPSQTLGSGATVNLTVKAADSTGTGVPGALIYLSFGGSGTAPLTGTATASANCPVTPTSLSTTPVACLSDANGTAQITYTAASPVLTGGFDRISAANAASNPTISANDDYHYSHVASYAFSVSPIAPAGSLSPSHTVDFAVTARDQGSAGVAGATVYLSLTSTSVAGSATAGPSMTPLTPQPVAFTTDGSGQVALHYTTPPGAPPAAVTDTITAQDLQSGPTVTQTDSYSYPHVTQYVMSPSPIAAAGTLASGAHVPVTLTTEDSGNNPVAGATVWLSFTAASGGNASATANGTPLTGSPHSFTSNGSGQVALAYTASSSGSPSGSDTVTAQDASTSPAITSSDAYSYSPVAGYTFGTGHPPIAPAGSLAPSTTTMITVKPVDAGSATVPDQVIYLSLDPAMTGSTSGGTAKVGTTSLTTTPQAFAETGTAGVTVAYATPGTEPTGGQDILVAQNLASSPTARSTDTYAYATVTHYVATPSPIASAGTLVGSAANRTVGGSFQALDGTDTPVPGAVVYLSLQQLQCSGHPCGGTASSGATSLTGTPTAITADVNGRVTFTYTAPSTAPASGIDSITATDATTNPVGTTVDPYEFATPSSYAFSPAPIAAPGQAAPVTQVAMTVTDAGANPVPYAQVFLSQGAGNQGAAAVGSTGLTATPQPFFTDGTGSITLTYTRAAGPPTSGTDTLSAAASNGGPEVAGDTYVYTQSFAFSPNPLGTPGMLAHDTTVPVTLTVSSGGAPLSGGSAWLSLAQAPGGGTATAPVADCPALPASGQLGSTPVLCTADASGQIPLSYQTPSTLPFGGADVINAQNTQSAPTLTTPDAYTFANGGAYHPLQPFRIYDTRPGSGEPGAGQRFHGGTTEQVQVAGVPSSGVPASGAIAAVLNVTATGETAPSFLTVFPAGTALPLASNLNFVPNEDVANLVEVPLGSGGAVSVFNNSGDADVVVDVEGYVSETLTGNGAGLYNPLTPARIYDSRPGSGVNGAGTTLTPANHVDHVQVTGQGLVPAGGVAAVILNVTATQGDTPSFLTVWPSDAAQPAASNLNIQPHTDRPNRVIVPVSQVLHNGVPAGSVDIYNNAGSVDVVVDVGGWFTSGSGATTGGVFHPLPPSRVCDTRGGPTPCAGQTLGANSTLNVGIAGAGGVPSMAASDAPAAVVLNVTAPFHTTGDYFTVYPSDAAQPPTSDLNFAPNPGEDVPNLVVVRLGGDGSVNVYNHTGSEDVVIDVTGFYTDPVSGG